jgi:hypothetical protein
MGAATGAISSEVSGGKAGTGALVGAGTNIIGTALFDLMFTPSQAPQQNAMSPSGAQYYLPQSQPYTQGVVASGASTPSRKIIRTYDASGNLVTEEEYIL